VAVATRYGLEKRDEHRKPVIRAFVALPVETLVEVAARRFSGSGLCIYKNPATDNHFVGVID